MLRAEYGSWEYVLFWSMEVRDGKLRVTCGEREFSGALDAEQSAAFFRDADRLGVWELPCTDYDVDLSDDLYHMGVSVELEAPGLSFRHQVPTRQVVMVPSRRLAKKNYVAFSSFVQLTARRAAEISQIALPDYLLAKWKSRATLDALE